MPLHGYADQCRRLADELVDALSDTEVAQLHDWLTHVGLHAWLAWREAHAETVASFVAASPSVRAKRRQWQIDRPPLVLAAYEHCIHAADLLEAAAHIQAGGSYRRMAAEAGSLYGRLQRHADWPDWPWGDPDPYEAPSFLPGRE